MNALTQPTVPLASHRTATAATRIERWHAVQSSAPISYLTATAVARWSESGERNGMRSQHEICILERANRRGGKPTARGVAVRRAVVRAIVEAGRPLTVLELGALIRDAAGVGCNPADQVNAMRKAGFVQPAGKSPRPDCWQANMYSATPLGVLRFGHGVE